MSRRHHRGIPFVAVVAAWLVGTTIFPGCTNERLDPDTLSEVIVDESPPSVDDSADVAADPEDVESDDLLFTAGTDPNVDDLGAPDSPLDSDPDDKTDGVGSNSDVENNGDEPLDANGAEPNDEEVIVVDDDHVGDEPDSPSAAALDPPQPGGGSPPPGGGNGPVDDGDDSTSGDDDPDDGSVDDPPDDACCSAVEDWNSEWALFEREVLELVNLQRERGGDCGSFGAFESASPLILNRPLQCTARGHSKNMALSGFFDHLDPDGHGPGDRIDTTKFDWNSVGENIAVGFPTSDSVVNGWMNSEGHCANIMNPSFTDAGVGYYDGHFWTIVFGSR